MFIITARPYLHPDSWQVKIKTTNQVVFVNSACKFLTHTSQKHWFYLIEMQPRHANTPCWMQGNVQRFQCSSHSVWFARRSTWWDCCLVLFCMHVLLCSESVPNECQWCCLPIYECTKPAGHYHGWLSQVKFWTVKIHGGAGKRGVQPPKRSVQNINQFSMRKLWTHVCHFNECINQRRIVFHQDGRQQHRLWRGFVTASKSSMFRCLILHIQFR